MHDFNLHSEFYNQPILLTEEEQKKTLLSIREFFENISLLEVRILLNSLLEVALSTNNTLFSEAADRDTALYLINQLEKLVESAYIIQTDS